MKKFLGQWMTANLGLAIGGLIYFLLFGYVNIFALSTVSVGWAMGWYQHHKIMKCENKKKLIKTVKGGINKTNV